jgi:hypothetical protein
MRHDMHDLLTGRPRGNQSLARSIRGSRRCWRNRVERDGETAPTRLRMGMEFRDYLHRKEFSDHLRPFERWLDKQVGRKWSEVQHDFFQLRRAPGFGLLHLELHAQMLIEMGRFVHPRNLESGHRDCFAHLRRQRYGTYFVHPASGELCKVSRTAGQTEHEAWQQAIRAAES